MEAVLPELERETSELLSQLIQIDTSNPPGNETAVAESMAGWFARHGLKGEIVGTPVDRASYVLRLEGRQPGPSLLLLSHEDVVPANASDWQVPPFSGLIRDGYVWGRGATDIKNLVAANAVALTRLAAAGAPFAGTVTYACTADEERLNGGGIRWLLENRPDLVCCDYVLNEGDSAFTQRGDRRVFLLQSGEKGAAQFRIVVRGEAGHASMPLRRGSAVLAAARVIEALATRDLPVAIDEASRDIVELLLDDRDLRERFRDVGQTRAALACLAELDTRLADRLEPLCGTTLAPTIVRSNSESVNMHPTEVVVSVDCRTPVGRTPGDAEAEVRAALDGIEADWDLQWINAIEGTASPYPTVLSDAVCAVLQRHVPDSDLGHDHSVGFTDAHWLRASCPGVVAYNFAPYVEECYSEVIARPHNVDERIHVRDLAFQAFFAEQVALELLQ